VENRECNGAARYFFHHRPRVELVGAWRLTNFGYEWHSLIIIDQIEPILEPEF
jgi:hypothetical protein